MTAEIAGRCYGCGSESPPKATEVKLPTGQTVTCCGGRGRSGWGGSYHQEPSVRCLRLALEKDYRRGRCAVCGERAKAGDAVCPECRHGAEAWREDTEGKQWAVIAYHALYPSHIGYYPDELAAAVAEALTAEGSVAAFDKRVDRPTVIGGPERRAGHGSITSGMRAVLLVPRQINAAARLVRTISESLKAAHEAGFQRGRRWLGDLTEGRLSYEDLEESR